MTANAVDQLTTLQQRLGYEFSDIHLLQLALTHSSHSRNHNERLEFLGDSLLGAGVSILLYQAYPDEDEGALSRLRTRLVRGETLTEMARELALSDYLKLGLGERKSGGRLRDSTLADSFEAVLAAVYLDAGIDVVLQLIERLYVDRIAALPSADSLKDAKTRLQELLQAQGLGLPHYQLVEQTGPDHQRNFTVSCQLPGSGEDWRAQASSRRKAEQKAAAAALQALQS